MGKRFHTLRFIAGLYKVIAWIMLVGLVVGAVGSVVAGATGSTAVGARLADLTGFEGTGLLAAILIGVGLLLAGVFLFVLLYAAGEIVTLALAIEQNTRETSVYMRGDTGAPPYNA